MKRKKRASAEDEGPEPEFQVAPMADMLFVLLVFFMSITSTEVLQKVANIELARAQEAQDKKKGMGQSEVVINVAWDKTTRQGHINFGGKDYHHPDELINVLVSRIATAPDMRVVIRADQATEYAFIADVMRACAAAQIANVTFSVLTGGGAPPAPAAP